MTMKRIILCFPRDIPEVEAFRTYEVYEFEGSVKDLLVECAKTSLEFGSRRTFSCFFVLHREDWHEVIVNLDRYQDFYQIADEVLTPDMHRADKIAESLGIRRPTLLYMIWEPETFIEEEIGDLVLHCSKINQKLTSSLEKIQEEARRDARNMVGVEFAFLNIKDSQQFAERTSGLYFAFLYNFEKFMIVNTKCTRLEIYDSSIFDNLKDEKELFNLLFKLIQ